MNKTLSPIENFCDYYKDLKNKKHIFIFCEKIKENSSDKNYLKINSFKHTILSHFIPLLKNKRITLLIFDLGFEGEMTMESSKELIHHFHIPFIFIEFNILIFNIHEKKTKDFLNFFIQNGYKISLSGFLANKYISVSDLFKLNIEVVNLYIEFSDK